ncbi:hypothetical protein [Streptomyces catenulae]|uniref:hypothetical protein n=1 Tax=Streptomyces catenulae TaxID=66875 RepID=UPI0004BF3DF6
MFAALEVATGKVIGSLHRRHRAAEFKKFVAEIGKEPRRPPVERWFAELTQKKLKRGVTKTADAILRRSADGR